MRRRRSTDEHENDDRWLVSYADFITLLFAFFTAMYAISHVDMGKLELFTGSMRTAFGSAPGAASPVIEGVALPGGNLVSIEQEFRRIVTASAGGMSVRRDERGIALSLGEGVLFDSGRAEIRQEAAGVLGSIASVLKKMSNDVIIEGHTDNIPLSLGSRYSSNWELSTARATSVLSYLIIHSGLSPERLSAGGYGEFRPVSSNETPDGRSRNRRVDIVVLNRR